MCVLYMQSGLVDANFQEYTDQWLDTAFCPSSKAAHRAKWWNFSTIP